MGFLVDWGQGLGLFVIAMFIVIFAIALFIIMPMLKRPTRRPARFDGRSKGSVRGKAKPRISKPLFGIQGNQAERDLAKLWQGRDAEASRPPVRGEAKENALDSMDNVLGMFVPGIEGGDIIIYQEGQDDSEPEKKTRSSTSIYYFGFDDGIDTVKMQQKVIRKGSKVRSVFIVFERSVNMNGVEMRRRNDDLVIKTRAAAQEIVVQDHFSKESHSKLEAIKFEDTGEVLGKSGILEKVDEFDAKAAQIKQKAKEAQLAGIPLSTQAEIDEFESNRGVGKAGGNVIDLEAARFGAKQAKGLNLAAAEGAGAMGGTQNATPHSTEMDNGL